MTPHPGVKRKKKRQNVRPVQWGPRYRTKQKKQRYELHGEGQEGKKRREGGRSRKVRRKNMVGGGKRGGEMFITV